MSARKIRTVMRRGVNVLLAAILLVGVVGTAPVFALSSPELVKDILPGAESAEPTYYTEVNGTLFFAVGQGESYEPGLWKTDGTTAGTVPVKTWPGNDARPEYLTNVNGTLFFTLYDGAQPMEGLWKSDGTTAGTVRVKGNMDVFAPVVVNGVYYFEGDIRDEDVSGRQLWRSDGTEAGTIQISPLQPQGMAGAGNTLYFAAYDDDHGVELWKTDGTVVGTNLVKDLVPGPGNGVASLYATTGPGSMLYFSGTDTSGTGLWKTDGTENGTVKVKDVIPQGLTNINGTLYFTGYPSGNPSSAQNGLWKTDGTTVGTVFIKNTSITPSTNPAQILGNFTALNGVVLFTANNGSGIGTNGYELWKTDGTTAGTSMVTDLYPGEDSSYPTSFVAHGGNVYFQARPANAPNEGDRVLWKTDGTAAGTVQVTSLNDGPPYYADLTVYNNKFLFSGTDEAHGLELWRVDVAAPVVNSVTWTANPVNVGQNTTLQAIITDDYGVASASYSIDGGAPQTLSFNISSGKWEATFGSGLTPGSYPITVTAKDGAGNVSVVFSSRLNVTGAGVSSIVTGANRQFTPSATNGDVLPGMTTSNQSAAATYSMTVGYGAAGLNANNSFTFTYNSGNALTCLLFPTNANCHKFTMTADSFSQMTLNSTNYSQGMFTGTATAVTDGVTVIYPFTVELRDGNRVGTTTQDHFTLYVYPVGSDPHTATPLYHASADVARTQITIQ